MKRPIRVLIGALAALVTGSVSAADILYQTGFEPPELTAGLPLTGQDGWQGGWFPPSTSHPTIISEVNARDGLQSVRFYGADGQGLTTGNAFAFQPLFDLNHPAAPPSLPIVEISVDVRLDGPLIGTLGAPEQDLLSANLFAVVRQNDRDPFGLFDIGGFFVSGAGRIWAYHWVTGIPGAIYGNSIPYVMGTYHSLRLRVNFLTRTLTYFVDGVELDSAAIPLAIKSEQLFSGYLSMYGRTQVIETPELSYNRANYNAYFDNYSLASVPLTSTDTVVQFSATDYAVVESDPVTTIEVVRRGYTNDPARVTVITGDGTATAGQDYEAIAIEVAFAPGETAKTVQVPIKNDRQAERDETIQITLVEAPDVLLPRPTAVLWILDDERDGSLHQPFHFNPQPLGLTRVYEAPSIAAVGKGKFLATVFGEDGLGNYLGYLARFQGDGSVDPEFTPYPLPYGTGPSQVTMLKDYRLLLNVGDRLVRLKWNGEEDASFAVVAQVGSDPGFIADVLVQPDQSILLVGFFDQVNGVARKHIARVGSNGEVDAGFDAGESTDDYILDAALQTDGRILMVGAFQNVAGQPRPGLARLNRYGSLDLSLDPGIGFSAPNGGLPWLSTVMVQPHGRILVGGYFDSCQGVSRASLARLLPNGTLDTAFGNGGGFESGFNPGTPGFVNGLALLPDGNVLVTGGFGAFAGVPATGVVRLNRNGSLDRTFQVSGNDSFAAALNGGPSLALLPDGDILTFLSSNVSFIKDEPVRYQGIVRLNGYPSNVSGFEK
jgi:uncharacterized delta-60 repeat protein